MEIVLQRETPCIALFLVRLFGRPANDLSRFTEKNEILQEINGIFTEHVANNVKVL